MRSHARNRDIQNSCTSRLCGFGDSDDFKDVRIDLASDISIFVGANNSGKTSASHALQLFMAASRERFSVHDFSAESWAAMDAFGNGVEGAVLPTISLDIWFHVDAPNLHRVVDLLPSLAWEGALVGLRVEFAATDAAILLANFREARERARANIRPRANGAADFHPSPRTLREFLADNLRREYELRYYVLDRAQFGADFAESAGYILARPLLKRASFTSLDDLQTRVLNLIHYFNHVLKKPFRWTYTGRPLQA